jgi:hypothetical protein
MDAVREATGWRRGAVRIDLKAILRDPAKRRKLMVRTIIATQAREGITTTQEQAEAAYDKVQNDRRRTASN